MNRKTHKLIFVTFRLQNFILLSHHATRLTTEMKIKYLNKFFKQNNENLSSFENSFIRQKTTTKNNKTKKTHTKQNKNSLTENDELK